MGFEQVVLFGLPASGLETQAVALAQRWQVPSVALDDLATAAIASLSPTGMAVMEAMETGPLPDDLALTLVRHRLEQPDAMLQGWVLSGFPRTVAQAEGLGHWLAAVGQPMPQVAYLKCAEGLLLKRLSEQRPGMPIPALRRQLAQHQAALAPLLEYYQAQGQLTTINASQSAAEITQALVELAADDGNAPLIRDEAELDALLSRSPLLVVDCMASWCGSCRLVNPLINQLATAYGDRAQVMRIDFDRNQQLPQRFGLEGMPAVMVFKNGQLQETLTGVKPYEVYSAAVSRCLESA